MFVFDGDGDGDICTEVSSNQLVCISTVHVMCHRCEYNVRTFVKKSFRLHLSRNVYYIQWKKNGDIYIHVTSNHSQCVTTIHEIGYKCKYIITIIRSQLQQCHLTHWGRVTHICVDNLTIIDPDNGLLPGRHQAIIWNNAGILSIGLLGTDFSEILIWHFLSRKCAWKCGLQNGSHFVSASMC